MTVIVSIDNCSFHYFVLQKYCHLRFRKDTHHQQFLRGGVLTSDGSDWVLHCLTYTSLQGFEDSRVHVNSREQSTPNNAPLHFVEAWMERSWTVKSTESDYYDQMFKCKVRGKPCTSNEWDREHINHKPTTVLGSVCNRLNGVVLNKNTQFSKHPLLFPNPELQYSLVREFVDTLSALSSMNSNGVETKFWCNQSLLKLDLYGRRDDLVLLMSLEVK